MDADIYGPNIPRMFGLSDKPEIRAGRIVPLERYGVKVMSLGLLGRARRSSHLAAPPSSPKSFSSSCGRGLGTLDYLIVDLPPGTGDAQLSLAQAVPLRGGLIVTTPQEWRSGMPCAVPRCSSGVNVPSSHHREHELLRVSPLRPANRDLSRGRRHAAGRRAGGSAAWPDPLQSGVADLADAGKPIIVADPESPAARALADMAAKVAEVVGTRSVALPIPPADPWRRSSPCSPILGRVMAMWQK